MAAAILWAVIATGCYRDRGAPPDQRMSPCPDSPNCVATTTGAADDKWMPPLQYTIPEPDVVAAIRAAIAEEPRADIVVDEVLYLRAEFRSLVFRFVDDVEFQLDPQRRRIEFRSASRTGYSDLGVNRRRMTRLTERLTARDGIRFAPH